MYVEPIDDYLDGLRGAVRSSRHSQAAIARYLGISEKHLSMFMQRRSDLSVDLLRRLCAALGLENPSGSGSQAQEPDPEGE